MRTKPDLLTAPTFMWRTARLLDRLRFGYLFLGGEWDPVPAALRAYQNPDGGFGNALEPDFRGAVSQPVACAVPPVGCPPGFAATKGHTAGSDRDGSVKQLLCRRRKGPAAVSPDDIGFWPRNLKA